MKQAGYRTGGVGKWSLGDAGTVGRATNQGFDTWLGYLNQDHAHYYSAYLDDDEGRMQLDGNRQSRQHYSHSRDFWTPTTGSEFHADASQQPPFKPQEYVLLVT